MALLNQITTRHGLTLDTAYIVVGLIGYNKLMGSTPDPTAPNCHCEVCVFVNKESRELGKPEIDRFSFAFNIDIESEDNYIKQAYMFLKNQQIFTESVDV